MLVKTHVLIICTTHTLLIIVVLIIGLERQSYTVSETIRVVNVSGSGNMTGKNTTVVHRSSVTVCAVVLNGTIENGTNALVSFSTQSGTAIGSGECSLGRNINYLC